MATHWNASLILVFILILLGIDSSSQQLQSSQTQVLQQLRKLLEYPKQLDSWNNNKQLCSVPKSPALSITCEENSIIELKIVGDKLVKVNQYEGYSLPNQTLSQDFSVDSFITTLTKLTSLRSITLVSLGIWGALPDKIHRLYALEMLDLSSNFLYGSIPPKLSATKMLQILTLDGNFFNGTVPDWFDSLAKLTVLSMKSNQLSGPLPGSLASVRTLTSLELSTNNISGQIPDLAGLINLEVLDLTENELDSELPFLPKNLVTVLLSRNSLSGVIPQQYKELTRLHHLDISFNLLSAIPPSSIFSLPNITYLNMESNMLSGSLPSDLTCSNQLSFVDISTNKLTGELPACLSANSNKRIVKFSGNCMVVDPKHQHEASFCKIVESSKSKGRVLLGLLSGAVLILLLLVLLFLVFYRKKFQKSTAERHLLQKPVDNISPMGVSTKLLTDARLVSHAKKHGTQNLPLYRVFSLEELEEATNNFNRSSYIGEGSTGMIYKGRLENGACVAIKCLSFFKKYPIRNLNLRLELLLKLRHPHLVCLLGYCTDNSLDDSSVNRVFLVYEFFGNGNLRTHLSEKLLERVLKWTDRLSVLVGIAKAVHFLHTGIIPGFFNNKLKTSNILLDDHLMAKVSDYGLSIITEEIDRHESRTSCQKSGNAIQRNSPEWKPTNLDDDIYMFGFILLETIAGPSLIQRGEAFFLTEVATLSCKQEELKHIVDPIVLSTSSHDSLSTVVSITIKCLSPDQSSRPSIEDVLWNLQYAAQVQMQADGDQISDATSQTSQRNYSCDTIPSIPPNP